MENTLIFTSEKEVRFGKLLKFIIPTYLTSLFNTVYTIIDGIFVSAYVGTDALASINIVYPIVNVLTGIALVFATGGSAVAALHIGGNRKAEGDRSFSVSTVAAILLLQLRRVIITVCIDYISISGLNRRVQLIFYRFRTIAVRFPIIIEKCRDSYIFHLRLQCFKNSII